MTLEYTEHYQIFTRGDKTTSILSQIVPSTCVIESDSDPVPIQELNVHSV